MVNDSNKQSGNTTFKGRHERFKRIETKMRSLEKRKSRFIRKTVFSIDIKKSRRILRHSSKFKKE